MNVEEVIKTTKVIPVETRTIIHLQLVANKVNEILSQALKPHGVSLQQFNVLRILRGRKGEAANLSTLNERMVTKMSNTTRLVDKLILKGYVKRNVCEHNRRKVEIFITSEGTKVLTGMDESIKNAQHKILKDFEIEELQQLNTLFDKF
ncbi:MarR family winged helix-turn-helix transcriptional regulator [Croceivirga thetidis]|uniref:MarR family transcriptional regulator n=1 Tax=Croceivirga thetidis TaxID=2721623 RepID=A0ABX1GWZ9_9FLAO|nr:MarR family transcriptional regulator [Croceivirga thetidis]NKI33405.1 MarR family transcriptional regulator [Croceivirga thetidis]